MVDDITSLTSREPADGGFLGLARALARIAVVVGAAGSVALMVRAGRRTPLPLLVVFIIWVLSPFVALGWANLVSRRWSVLTRATLFGVTLVITLVTLAVYWQVVSLTASPRAVAFLLVPSASWLFMTIAVGAAAFVSRRLAHT